MKRLLSLVLAVTLACGLFVVTGTEVKAAEKRVKEIRLTTDDTILEGDDDHGTYFKLTGGEITFADGTKASLVSMNDGKNDDVFMSYVEDGVEKIATCIYYDAYFDEDDYYDIDSNGKPITGTLYSVAIISLTDNADSDMFQSPIADFILGQGNSGNLYVNGKQYEIDRDGLWGDNYSAHAEYKFIRDNASTSENIDTVVTPEPETKPETTPENKPEDSPAPSAPVAGSNYTVKKGDSLWKIAKEVYKDGSKYMTIYNANKNILKNPNTLRIGQVLVIPAILENDNNNESNPSTQKPVQGSPYTVKKGDNLWKIAKEVYKDGSKYMTIYNANKNILKSPNTLSIGQVLTIPAI